MRPEGRAKTAALAMDGECSSLLHQLSHALGVDPRQAAIGCFAALAYRHLQQPLISIAVRDAGSSKVARINCSVSEATTLPQLIEVVAEQWRTPRAAQL